MSYQQASFSEMWHRHDDFEFSEPQPDFCPLAAQFSQWAVDLISEVSDRSTEAAVHIGKLLLLDRYWAFYNTVSKVHKNHIGTREGHVCIFQVFQNAYNALHTLELSLTPPRMNEPPPPEYVEAKRMAQIPALFLGEIEE